MLSNLLYFAKSYQSELGSEVATSEQRHVKTLSPLRDCFIFIRVSGHRHLCLPRVRHIRATLPTKKCFPRRSSTRWIGILGFRLPLDVAYKSQTGDVAPVQATAQFSHSRPAQDPLAWDPIYAVVRLPKPMVNWWHGEKNLYGDNTHSTSWTSGSCYMR